MNGGLGFELNGFSSTERTEKSDEVRPSRRASACSSFRTVTSLVRWPVSSKSLPLAMRLPSRATSVAEKRGSVAKAASRSQ